MFKRMRLGSSSGDPVSDMGNAPLTAYAKAQQKFFEIYGSPKVESARWFVIAVIEFVVILAMAGAIRQMLPLKEVRPYMVDFDERTGAVARPVEAQLYKPTDAVKKYFLSEWVKKLLTLDPYLTEKNIKAAYALTRDKANAEFTEWLTKDKPIERLFKDPTLTRVVSINAVNAGREDGIAFVRVTTQERSGTSAAASKIYMITIHYALVPPQTEMEIQANPLGMFITHFVVSEEISN